MSSTSPCLQPLPPSPPPPPHPTQDVAVNVVGKYRYRMTSPADSTSVPLIIDIILVGRTKIITLHRCAG